VTQVACHRVCVEEARIVDFAALGEGRVSELILTGPESPAIAAADKELIAPLFQWRYNGRSACNGWNSPVNNAQWGTDYLNRTATAKSNLGRGITMKVVTNSRHGFHVVMASLVAGLSSFHVQPPFSRISSTAS
jgi:hypothetical protein